MFVHEHDRLRRRGRDEVRLLAENAVLVFTRERYATHPRIDAVAANTRLRASPASVRRAMINACRSVVRPECPALETVHVGRVKHARVDLSKSGVVVNCATHPGIGVYGAK